MVRAITRRECIGGFAGIFTVSSGNCAPNRPESINSRFSTDVDWPLEWLLSRVEIVFERSHNRGFTRRELAHRLSIIEAAETPGSDLNELVANPHIVIHGALLLSALRELQRAREISKVRCDGQTKYLVLLKRPESCGSGAEAVVDVFDGTFESEFAELAIPAAAG
jgi:hypothetical protein